MVTFEQEFEFVEEIVLQALDEAITLLSSGIFLLVTLACVYVFFRGIQVPLRNTPPVVGAPNDLLRFGGRSDEDPKKHTHKEQEGRWDHEDDNARGDASLLVALQS